MVWKFHDHRALLDRLSRPEPSRDHIFLFGAALTAPVGAGAPGVPGIAGVVDLIRAHYRAAYGESALAELDTTLQSQPEQAYKAAFEHLQGRGNTEDANRIIRRAVLRARTSPPPAGTSVASVSELQRLQLDGAGWHLAPAVAALGRLLSTRPPGFAPLVLTTNFDPLIEVSIERAGGHAYWSMLDSDGRLDQVHGAGCHVVHLHGYWLHSDTLHTGVQLGQDRPQLQASLQQILANRAVVVIGYGGWDDVFARALTDVLDDPQQNCEIIWAFYPEHEHQLVRSYEPLLSRLKSGYQRGRVTLFKGIDLHWLLPALAERLTGAQRPPESLDRDTPAPPPPQPTAARLRGAPSSSPTDAVEALPLSASPVRGAGSSPAPAGALRERQIPPRWLLRYVVPALAGVLAIYYFGSTALISCGSPSTVPSEPAAAAPAAAPADTTGAAEATVRSYWQSLNQKDYEPAWRLLSPSFQSRMHAGSYDDYERTHSRDGVCSVRVDQTSQEQQAADRMLVRARLFITSGAGCSKEREQSYVFTMKRESPAEPWRIDGVK